MSKKILVLLLCLTVAFAFAACGSDEEKSEKKEDKKTEQSAADKKKEKAEKLAGEYKDVIDDYSAKLKNKGKALLEQFDSKKSEFSKNSEGLKDLVKKEQTKLAAILKEGNKGLRKVCEANKDKEKNLSKKKDELKRAYDSAYAPIRSSFKSAEKAAVEAEKKAKEEREAKEKAAQEKAAKEKAAKDKQKKKNSNSSNTKKQEEDKFAIAKSYKGKDIKSLIARIGRPSSTDISNSCSETNGKEGMYYWPGFYVMAQSQEQDSPMIIKEVGSN